MLAMQNKFGQIDLSLIDPAQVAKLSDEQQVVLAVLVEAVQNRDAAHERLRKAKEAVREAMRIEADAQAAHQAANPPPSRLEALRAAQDAYNKSQA
jgi:hypothetical protein